MSDRRTCPDAAAIAAFIDGTLSAQEARAVAAHIAECDECVAEVGDISLFASEERGATAAKPSHRWSFAIAAALAVAVIGSGIFVYKQGGLEAVRYRWTIRPLVAAMANTQRPVEGRLEGFPWSEKRPVNRGVQDDLNWELEGAAVTVLQNTGNSTTPLSQHAAGVAKLMRGDSEGAIAALTKAAAERPRDAAIWNDLASALHRAGKYDRALDAANRALTIRSDMPEALFNRALILSRMQRDQEAIAAWRRYLSADPSSPWAKEAQNNLDRLTHPF